MVEMRAKATLKERELVSMKRSFIEDSPSKQPSIPLTIRVNQRQEQKSTIQITREPYKELEVQLSNQKSVLKNSSPLHYKPGYLDQLRDKLSPKANPYLETRDLLKPHVPRTQPILRDLGDLKKSGGKSLRKNESNEEIDRSVLTEARFPTERRTFSDIGEGTPERLTQK